MGAEAFNDRVRDGIGFRHLAIATRPAKDRVHNQIIRSMMMDIDNESDSSLSND